MNHRMRKLVIQFSRKLERGVALLCLFKVKPISQSRVAVAFSVTVDLACLSSAMLLKLLAATKRKPAAASAESEKDENASDELATVHLGGRPHAGTCALF